VQQSLQPIIASAKLIKPSSNPLQTSSLSICKERLRLPQKLPRKPNRAQKRWNKIQLPILIILVVSESYLHKIRAKILWWVPSHLQMKEIVQLNNSPGTLWWTRLSIRPHPRCLITAVRGKFSGQVFLQSRIKIRKTIALDFMIHDQDTGINLPTRVPSTRGTRSLYLEKTVTIVTRHLRLE